MNDLAVHLFFTSVYIQYGNIFYPMFPDKYGLAKPSPVFLLDSAHRGIPFQGF